MLRDVDPDLQRSLRLPSAGGALVQDVTLGSPGARAGLRPYDVIVGVDGGAVEGDDSLIQQIAAREPGTAVTLQVLRDGRPFNVALKLAERPRRDQSDVPPETQPVPSSRRGSLLGLSVREMDDQAAVRYRLPDDMRGVIVSRVEPTGPAFDAGIDRGHVLLEINRQPVRSIDDYRRLTDGARPGDVLAMYVYKPELGQRTLDTIKIDER
jgi:serine protease Do